MSTHQGPRPKFWRLYPKDFWGDGRVQDLGSGLLRSAYLALLSWAWERGAVLPDPTASLRAMGFSPQEATSIWDSLRHLWIETSEGWTQARLRRDFAADLAARAAASEGGRNRWSGTSPEERSEAAAKAARARHAMRGTLAEHLASECEVACEPSGSGSGSGSGVRPPHESPSGDSPPSGLPSLAPDHPGAAPSEPASPRSRVAAFPETSDTGSTSEPSEVARSMAGLPEALESKRRGPPNRRGKEAPPTLARCLEILRAEHPLLQAVAGLPEALAEWYAALAETRGKKTWATERAWRLMLRRLESDPGHAVRAVQKATEGSAAGPWLGIEAALEHVHRSGNGTYAASHASSRRNGYEKPRTGKW